MKLKSLLFSASLSLGLSAQLLAQTTTCPAPTPGQPNCYQTTRPLINNNPLTNHPPIPNQDCCNAIPLCLPLNEIDNGVVIPEGGPAGALYPGCVQDELPNPNNTCFSNNEKGTTWYKFQIRPLPGGPTAPGSPAGKLRFKIVPLDALEDPDYDPFTDDGATGYGATDYDFLLFKIPASAANDGAACTLIRNSPAWNTPNSVIASCNWTGTRGPTGLFEPGTGTESAQGPATRFNVPLSVKVGDLFYLAIDNFSVNTQGFQVDFRGLEAPDDSTAIVNPPPTDSIKIASVTNPVCQSQTFVIKFDKPVRCDSVKPNKFTISGLAPNLSIISITPEGGCNPGGQDTSFVVTISPFQPDTTIKIIVTADIRDICGNKVISDTAYLRIEFPIPLTFNIVDKQASCGIPEITVAFAKKVYCDSVQANKFQLLRYGVPYGSIESVRRANKQPCTFGTLDSLYVLRFSKAAVDSVNFALALNGINDVIRDFCGNPVAFDTIPFKINPWLNVEALPTVVCPNKATTLTALLDSTFDGYANDSLVFNWFNLNTNNLLVEDDETSFAPGNDGIVKIKRDLTIPETVLYRLVVQNTDNGCLDTTEVPVRFSARPELEAPSILTYCYGEEFSFKPVFTNAKPSELDFAWFRKGALSDTLSKDSVFTDIVDDSLIARGLDQTYLLNVKYLDTLGGCVANPFELRMRYGRKIMPKIQLDSASRYASITPAEFEFGNASSFTPPKTGSKYDWDFGKGLNTSNNNATTFGLVNTNAVYELPNKSGEGYTVTLTAYDTLFSSAVQVGKVCQNQDSIKVFVQNLIPSLVTNNGDGVNDNFSIQGMRANTFSMKLYNRWGKLVADQDPFSIEGWDPKDVGPGVYYYILTEKRSGKNLVSWLTISK